MERVQQFISQQNIWMRALLLTLAISLALFIVGLLMGKLRHLVIEGCSGACSEQKQQSLSATT